MDSSVVYNDWYAWYFMQRLSEHAVSVGRLCGQLSEEYQLQYSGWNTALANCDSIVR